MSILEILILIHPIRRLTEIKLGILLYKGWKKEFIDFVGFAVPYYIPHLVERKNPQLSSLDVLPLRYVLKLVFDIFFQRRRIFPWKMEVKDLILQCITIFLMEIFIVNVIMGLFQNQKVESLWWLIFIVCTIPALKLFPKLPLDAINREEENLEDEQNEDAELEESEDELESELENETDEQE